MFCILKPWFHFLLAQKDANGRVWVHNNKQGFQDCEAYALLEDWLGNRVDEYWDKNFDTIQVVIYLL